MAYIDDLNQFASQNPDDAYIDATPQGPDETQGDPLLAGRIDTPGRGGRPDYSGLTGDPFQTALVATAQLEAFRPQPRQPAAQPPPPPFAGLSAYLGA